MLEENKKEVVDFNEIIPGCDLEASVEHDKDERNFRYSNLVGNSVAVAVTNVAEVQFGAINLPNSFGVDTPQTYQGKQPACVGHGVGGHKSDVETKEAGIPIILSPRFLYSLCKREQGFIGWGTNVPLAVKMVAEYGIPTMQTIPEAVDLSEEVYVKICDNVGQEVYDEAKKYKAQRTYWHAYNDEVDAIKLMLFNEKVSLPTTLPWYSNYNYVPNGYLPKPVGNSSGHCVRLKHCDLLKYTGHDPNYKGIKGTGMDWRYTFKNSYGLSYGVNGDFYVWEHDLVSVHQIGTFFSTIDIPKVVATILNKYQGKVIKNPNNPTCYLVDKKRVINIGDETTYNVGKDLTNPLWQDWPTILTVEDEIVETHKIIISETK